jgi:hypothetical protein
MALNQDVVEAVANANFKTHAEGGAYFLNLAMGDAVAHQRRTHVVAENANGTCVKNLIQIDPEEAVSISKVTTGNDLGQQIMQLAAALGAGQIGTKVAQTTPPVTPKK